MNRANESHSDKLAWGCQQAVELVGDQGRLAGATEEELRSADAFLATALALLDKEAEVVPPRIAASLRQIKAARQVLVAELRRREVDAVFPSRSDGKE